MGGGGGADDPGIGGGGGGALGAPESGIGGGGGGGTEELDSKAPDIDGPSCTGVEGLLSIADKGRGGAMVPKRMDARCLADPPVGPSPSSLESSLSDSATDHSSSSGRLRDWGPV